MNQTIGIVLIAVGGVLIFFGFRAEDSFASGVSQFLSGEPTDNTIWLFVAGIASAVAGIVITARNNWSRN